MESAWRKWGHSSEIRGLCFMKFPSEMLQNLSYFWNTETHVVFFVFIFFETDYDFFSEKMQFLKKISHLEMQMDICWHETRPNIFYIHIWWFSEKDKTSNPRVAESKKFGFEFWIRIMTPNFQFHNLDSIFKSLFL